MTPDPNPDTTPPRDDPPPVLYHYTTWKGLIGILTSKEIWASHHAALNDREETTYARNLLREYARGLGGTPGLQILKRIKGKASKHVMVASFSEENDLLSQWRAYGDRGCGVSVGFRSEELRRLRAKADKESISSPDLRRVVYAPGEQIALLRQTLPKLTEFADLALRLKNPHFYEEREWRLVVTTRDASHFEVRESQFGLVAYLKLRIPGLSELIESITMGPGCHDHHHELTPGIKTLLAKHARKAPSPRRFFSQAPLKGGV